MTQWNEDEHPRDKDGKFIYKVGGTSTNDNENGYVLKGGIEKNVYKQNRIKSKIEQIKEKIIAREKREKEKQEKRANILYPDMPDNPRIQEIKKAGEKELREIEKERILGHTKNFGLAALEIGSAFVPGLGEAKIAANLTKALAPKVGRAIAKEVAKGTTRGAFSGGLTGSIHGLGEGIDNNENLILSAAKGGLEGAALGTIGGASIGLGTGKTTQLYKGIKLKDFKDSSNVKIDKKKISKSANDYYKDFEQGININRNDIGEIKLTNDAFKETTKQNIKMSDSVINLSKKLKSAKYIGSEIPKHEHPKYKIVKFHRLSGDIEDYLISENEKGEKYFYKAIEKNKK